jgi:peptidoglycan/xylan/chitin deacetylase (PgdA/CDA1 family)
VKRLLKFALAVFLFITGLTAWRLRLKGKNRPALILMYHRVLPDSDPEIKKIQPGLYVTPENFEKQIAYLAPRFQFIPLSRLVGMISEGRPLSGNYAVITFDDGWSDNFEFAFPILRAHNVPATIFLTTGYIESHRTLWFYQAVNLLNNRNLPTEKALAKIIKAVNNMPVGSNLAITDSVGFSSSVITIDRLIELMKQLDNASIYRIISELKTEVGIAEDAIDSGNNMLSWKQVSEMSTGGIEFGSHGVTHSILTRLNPDEVTEELKQSKETIANRLGKEITLFSYPNGDYNFDIEHLVQQAGYKCAVATKGENSQAGEIDLFALKRVGVHEDTCLGPKGRFSRAMFAYHLAAWREVFGWR